MSTQQERILRELDTREDGLTAPELAERLDAKVATIHAHAYVLRQKHYITSEGGRHRITLDGREAIANSGATPSTARARRKQRKPAASPPPKSAVSLYAPPTERRALPKAQAAHLLADGLIANAERSLHALCEYLDESCEITPLMRAHLEAVSGAIALIKVGYEAAR